MMRNTVIRARINMKINTKNSFHPKTALEKNHELEKEKMDSHLLIYDGGHEWPDEPIFEKALSVTALIF